MPYGNKSYRKAFCCAGASPADGATPAQLLKKYCVQTRGDAWIRHMWGIRILTPQPRATQARRHSETRFGAGVSTADLLA
jgi:hypothetical protein